MKRKYINSFLSKKVFTRKINLYLSITSIFVSSYWFIKIYSKLLGLNLSSHVQGLVYLGILALIPILWGKFITFHKTGVMKEYHLIPSFFSLLGYEVEMGDKHVIFLAILLLFLDLIGVAVKLVVRI